MEFLMGSEFGRLFFAFGTVIILSLLWFGYYRSVYVDWLSRIVLCVLVVYMVTFLLYRYFTAHIAHHMQHEPLYVVLGAIHGTISLAAILYASIVFFQASKSFKKNENYFRVHKIGTLMLSLLWPAALLSGMLI
jgi:hypothetical protein